MITRFLMSRLDPTAQLLLNSLLRRSGGPSPIAMMIGTTLGVAALFGLVFVSPPAGQWILLLALISTLIMPTIMVVVAATFASQFMEGEQFVLLSLTNLTGRSLFQAQTLAVLYKMRVFLLCLFVLSFVSSLWFVIQDSSRLLIIMPAILLNRWTLSIVGAAFAIDISLLRHSLPVTIFITLLSLTGFDVTITVLTFVVILIIGSFSSANVASALITSLLLVYSVIPGIALYTEFVARKKPTYQTEMIKQSDD